ncbi:MAG: hypothetical protein WAR41_08505 [Azonexus sp.]|jgi:hypothetical protein
MAVAFIAAKRIEWQRKPERPDSELAIINLGSKLALIPVFQPLPPCVGSVVFLGRPLSPRMDFAPQFAAIADVVCFVLRIYSSDPAWFADGDTLAPAL